MNLDKFFGEETKEGVAFFDLSQLMIATIMKTFKPEDPINELMVRHLILDTVRSNIMRFKKDYPTIVLATDARDGYWRRDVAWYYKKSRKTEREKSSYDWNLIFGIINNLLDELIEVFPRKIIAVSKVEADDIIAVLTKELSEKGHPIMIVSSDSDYVQLHTYKNVKQWSPMQKKLVKPKVSVHADFMVKLVKGDKKDCVAPIKCRSSYYADRIDGERAPSVKTTWLQELTDAEDATTLLEGSELERYKENQELLDFKKIPQKIVDSIINAYYTATAGSRGGFYSYLIKNRCAAMINKISEF